MGTLCTRAMERSTSLRKFLILLVLPVMLFLSLGAASAPASANEPAVVQASTIVPTAVCDDCGGQELTPEQRNETYAKSWFIPVNRWDNMSFHSRLNWWQPVNAATSQTWRTLASGQLSLGNGVWGTATDWSRSATTFDALGGFLGYQVDKFVGVLGGALIANPTIFAAIFVLVVSVSLWRAMSSRGPRPWGKALQAAIVMAVIVVMTTQAAAGTSGDFSNEYNPRPGSPVWLASALSGSIDTVAGSLVNPLMQGARASTSAARDSEESSTRGWNCDAALNAQFDLSTKYTTPTPGAEAVTVAINSLWANTALPTYSAIQFGSSNPYAKSVYCRQLERTTDADNYSKAQLLSQALFGTTTDFNKAGMADGDYGPILEPSSDIEVNDHILVALAACAPKSTTSGTTFTVRAGWRTKTGGEPWITPEACRAIFAAKDDDGVKAADVFDIGGEASDARKLTSDAGVLNYLESIHGSDNGATFAGTTSGGIYLVGSLIGGAIFGVLGLVVFGAKIVLLFMVAMLFVILLISLFRREPAAQTLGGPAQKLLGTAVFAFGSSLLLAVLATFSVLISTLGAMFGEGSLGALLWTAISPLGAVIAVHFIFTKMLRLPSPVTPRGALAWGTAGGAIGGALGAAATNRVMNRAGALGRKGRDALGAKTLGKSKATAWMMNKNMRDIARGAGDAGSRPVKSNEAAAESETVAGAAVAATGELTRKEQRVAKRQANREFRQENPGITARSIAKAKGAWGGYNDKRLSALQSAADKGALDGGRGGVGLPAIADADARLLKNGAAGRVSLTNAGFDMDNFMAAPGTAAGTLEHRDAAAWGDLSVEGKRQATRRMLQQRSDALKAKAAGQTAIKRAALITQRVAGNIAGHTAGAVGTSATRISTAASAVRAAPHKAADKGRDFAKTKTGKVVVAAGAAAGAVGFAAAGGLVPLAAGAAGAAAIRAGRHARDRREKKRAFTSASIKPIAKNESTPTGEG